LAWNAFEAVREKIKADPQLHGKVRLVFFSFDPVHDSSETLQFLADSYKADGKIAPMAFIASWSTFFLKHPCRVRSGNIRSNQRARGEPRVVINHLLKVFLIDRRGWVREIYTSAFLNQMS